MIFGHFGAIRGKDEFANLDCLVIIGRHQLPPKDLKNYARAIYGEDFDLNQSNSQEILGVPFRMKDGSAHQINNYIYSDDRLHSTFRHFCQAETIQAIGRGRLVWGKTKDIYLLTKESMGDVEIAELISETEIFPDIKYNDVVLELKKIGYCQDKPSELKKIGITTSQAKNDRKRIENAFSKAGIKLVELKIKNASRNISKKKCFIFDIVKLNKEFKLKGWTVI